MSIFMSHRIKCAIALDSYHRHELQNDDWTRTINAIEFVSYRLQMSTKCSSGTLNPKQTNKQTNKVINLLTLWLWYSACGHDWETCPDPQTLQVQLTCLKLTLKEKRLQFYNHTSICLLAFSLSVCLSFCMSVPLSFRQCVHLYILLFVHF